MLHTSTLSRLFTLVLLGISTAGCEVIGGIFRAGVWVGAIGVILIVVLLVVIVAKVRG